ncbi:MAG: flagellar basal-body rod protein FlgG [Myxococcales bacterium]|nr:flagellar basal-body rod protein FlgG [Myxococcales bacterium]
MLRALHSAATGMEAQQTYIDVTSNNLANVNTTGYKKSRANFHDLMYQIQKAPGGATSQATEAPTGIQIGLGVRTASTQKEFATGSLKTTGNFFDVAIQGDGFFQITTPDGQIGYARDGAFHRDENGQMVNANGLPLEPAITIPVEVTNITIGQDGTVTGQSSTQAEPIQLGQIQTVNFVNPAGLLAAGGNLYKESGSSGPPIIGNPGENGFGVLNQGFLEMSNVQVVEEMINLITAQRAFEFNSKAVQAADGMLRELGQLR